MADWKTSFLSNVRRLKGELADARRTVAPICPTKRAPRDPSRGRAGRKVDPKAIARCRARGYCELAPGHKGPFHVHHVKTRGAGGDDVDENLVLVCFVCHDDVHAGRISRDRVREVVAARLPAVEVCDGLPF